MDISKIQDYFKRKIAKLNFETKDVIQSRFNTWLSILVDNRPFLLKVNEIEVTQDGEITENYIQLGRFNANQQKQIYETTKRNGFIREYED